MSKYFLSSTRLGFRRWSDEDLELANGLWGDPEVTRWIGGPFTEEQLKDRLAKEISTMKSHGLQYWPIFLLSTGEHIGCCGLRPYKPEERIFELGFHIRTAHWGKGYASEAARAVMKYAFTELRAQALFAGHHPHNEVSRRLLQKLGFRYTHDEFYRPTGLRHPSYFLTAEEYKSTAEASGSIVNAPVDGNVTLGD
ncbi:GNAT family N-acetyltransferase [Candidatus Acetothermia bacterium]|nr:GNAT family N-acetyltransferase [Candidatus Acetothermia bacterium]